FLGFRASRTDVGGHRRLWRDLTSGYATDAGDRAAPRARSELPRRRGDGFGPRLPLADRRHRCRPDRKLRHSPPAFETTLERLALRSDIVRGGFGGVVTGGTTGLLLAGPPARAGW